MVREDVVVKAFTWANAVLRFVLELCMRRIPLEIALFGLATAALAAAGELGLAIAFGATAAVNTTLVHLLGEI
jgi:hypothetical protein